MWNGSYVHQLRYRADPTLQGPAIWDGFHLEIEDDLICGGFKYCIWHVQPFLVLVNVCLGNFEHHLKKVFAGDSILNCVCVFFLLFNILQWLICIHISCVVLGTRELVRVSQPHGSIQKSNSQHIHDNTMMINYQGWFTNMIKIVIIRLTMCYVDYHPWKFDDDNHQGLKLKHPKVGLGQNKKQQKVFSTALWSSPWKMWI